MSGKKDTQWFVRHLNPHTNEVIARTDSDAECCIVQDKEGNEFPAWQVPHWIISQLRGFKPSDGVSFMVYSRKGNRGPVRRNEFTRRKSPNKGSTFREAQKDLSDLVGKG